jgi:RNA polymerase sigma factor (sigma-70 family)
MEVFTMSRTTSTEKPVTDPDRAEAGRRGYEEGHSFEKRVSELYRLLHYDIEHGRLFSGRQIDLFLTGRFGDLTLYRAIECKVGPVKADHLDSFIAKLHLVRREYPSAQGTIVSAVSFTDAITSQAAQEGVQLTLYRDLAAQLFDGHAYVKGLMEDCETNERYQMSLYIEPSIGYEIAGESSTAFQVISDWLGDGDWNQLTLLGDVGTGKSFLSRMVAYRLAKAFLARPLENPLPVLIDLRNADRQFSLEGLVLTHLSNSGLVRVSFEVFQHALSQGNIVLILDGFDEMAARVTPQVTNRNFHELARCVEGRAKVLLTCRTHYFKSRTEEEEVILGISQDYGSETARDLYWELIARKGFKIAYLRPFEVSQVEAYVRRAKPRSARQALNKIRCTYNLLELSQRPMLLEMIVKSIDKLRAKQINPATLYKVYTDAWIHRDQWRDVLSSDSKLSFLMALAHSLWHEDAVTIHHTRLIEYLQQELATQIQTPQQLVELDNEIRTASFLTRDDSGHYGFAHKSYAEFFAARYLATELTLNRVDCLHTRRLSPELVSFLKYMVDPVTAEPLFEKILSDSYRPLISENALLCLYGFRRDTFFNSQDATDEDNAQVLVVDLPRRINLSGAQLDQVTLEGAVLKEANLSNANLSQAILARSDLSNARLDNANLEKAELVQSVCRSAEMSAANLAGANLDSADLSGANLRGANLTDAYLLQAICTETDLSNVIAKGAVLPDEIGIPFGGSADDEAFKSLLESNSQLVKQYWETILQLRPTLLRIARFMSLTADFDAEDIVSEVSVRLVRPNSLERLMKLDARGRQSYIATATKNMVKDRLRRRRKESTFTDLMLAEMNDQDFDAYINAIASAESDPLEKLIASETKEVSLTDIEDILSPESWRLVKARYVDARSLEDIALSEDISVRTAQRYLSKAREVVRRHFA